MTLYVFQHGREYETLLRTFSVTPYPDVDKWFAMISTVSKQRIISETRTVNEEIRQQ